jgi:cardiolipin synthase
VRDVIIVLGAAVYHFRVGDFVAEPSIISKLNSALQLLYILLILSKLVLGAPGAEVTAMLGWLVLVTTVVSGLDYVVRWTARARALGA